MIGETTKDKTVEDNINRSIAEGCDTNLISDGYHTFGELYGHRIGLFIALCRKLVEIEHMTGERVNPRVWRSKRHSDGSETEGWFVMGVGTKPGEQISYHLPDNKWSETEFANTLDTAPAFDGHTGNDVLERLRKI